MDSTPFSLCDSLSLTFATTIEECSSTAELTSRTGIDRMSTQTLVSATSSSSPSLSSESITHLPASISLTYSSILPLSTYTSPSSFRPSVFSSATCSSTRGVSPITTSMSLSHAKSSSVQYASWSSSTTVTVTEISTRTLKNVTGDNVVHLITVTSTYAKSTAAPYTTTSITSAISTATSTATSTAVTTSVSTATPSAVTHTGTTSTSKSGTAGKIVALAVVLSVTSLVAVVAIILWLRSRKPRKAPQITPFVSKPTVEDAALNNPPRRVSWIGKLGWTGSLGLEPGTSSSSQTYCDEVQFAYPAESAIAVDPRRSPSPSLNTRRSISTMDLLRRSWPGVPRASLSRTETRRSIETPLPHYPSSPSPNPMVSSAGFLDQDPYAWQSQVEGIATTSTDSNHGRSGSGQTLPPAYQPRQDVYWTGDL
ncbi:uncharacterized protein LAESUDRAFT_80657 [Laetiporus sulphureus 93-53]|uniref:Uncharacterized protein n=1 Tax=Laetiporus sulphureus 93-53 TaxID=1314785 RepID=A0A165F1X5_9APHY|nr:uncharacterized protein LAESUDRAFT_80657 [Laetiporus sulphureus 93-53]KZT08201.1 hypothetical protein LAESUDRAFT_80657 [Laetiporus sulphureus 93-53]